MKAAVFSIAVALLLLLAAPLAAQDGAQILVAAPDAGDDYVIAVQDVVQVTVWDNADLTGKYTVQPDGTVTMPLVGRVEAAGQTVRALERRLMRTLGDGFIREPRVSVTLDQFRGHRVFIFGAVGAPGTYALPDGQTLIEALVKAGSGGAAEAVIVRPRHPGGPMLPEHASDADVIRVNLREFEKDVERGSLARNVRLQDGDTIFVPRTDPTRIFVSGHVRNPGAYSITEGTTVLQALTLAGGVTESAAVNRLRILRLKDGKQRTIKGVKLSDVLQPGDTLIVPERFL